MPNWKKVVTSGSAAAFSSLIVSSTITGSISGSLTGSLQGNADTATTANTANTATTADTANAITSSITQNLTINGTVNINGSFSNRISYTFFNQLIAKYNNNGKGEGYFGEVFAYESGIGGDGGSRVIQWGWEPVGLSNLLNLPIPNNLVAQGAVGTVTVSIT
jgi:hypothetical protein